MISEEFSEITHKEIGEIISIENTRRLFRTETSLKSIDEFNSFYQAQNRLLRTKHYKEQYATLLHPDSNKLHMKYAITGSKDAKDFIKKKINQLKCDKPHKEKYISQVSTVELKEEEFPLKAYERLKGELLRLKAVEESKKRREERNRMYKGQIPKQVNKFEVDRWINNQFNKIIKH